MKKIRVMIVEDSNVIRQFLEYIIGQDSRLEVVASMPTGEEALEQLHKVSPDVISMDIRLPGMNGFETTQQIMMRKPTPIVVVSASVMAEDLNISMNALRAGALAVVEKPVGVEHSDYESLAERLCTQLAIMSEVKVIRQRLGNTESPNHSTATRKKILPLQKFQILGIVASTGGPSALAELLGKLRSDFPIPILLVQHIVPSFQEGFVAWLNTICQLPVQFSKDQELPLPGRIYVAPANMHLCIEMGYMKLKKSNPVCYQCPSGTVLFESLARYFGKSALGVLLTGMGEDGADGLLKIRKAGGYTLAEAESTAVVYGMPGAAAKIGAVCESLALPEIAPRILDLAFPEKD